ncbi:unnamed protein product [Meganyctiphanes norvegica]|uniref:FZ domain-containing protein n=1 Tax=Meganyctiphanes norvegica TaxID=48144 RepID=A0AAV2R426_MEGNR
MPSLFMIVLSQTISAALGRPCEELESDVCRGIGYNLTLFPNMFNHKTQQEAQADMAKFDPIIQDSKSMPSANNTQKYYENYKIACSEVLREFLCALYMPVCTSHGFHLPPCRELCVQARDTCEESLQEKGIFWPENFTCSKFSEHHELVCITSINTSVVSPLAPAVTSHPQLSWLGGSDSGKVEASPGGPHLTQCVTNADCIFERSVCRGGECVCEYPRTWGLQGCEETQILGGSCISDSQCAIVTPNAVCERSICTCPEPLTPYMNLACIHGNEYGSLCYNSAQCRAVNPFSFCRFVVAEVVGTCTCDTDQFISTRGRCLPRLGGRCRKGECPHQLGLAACQRGRDAVHRCFCAKGAVQHRGICVPQQ